MKRGHYVEIAHAGDDVYARCRCGWRGNPYPYPPFGTAADRERAVHAAEREARTHPGEQARPRRDWRPDAACRGQDVEAFFPLGTTGPALEQAEQAKAICARCKVRAECLAWALATHQDVGIWGGLTEQQRRTIRRGHQPRPR